VTELRDIVDDAAEAARFYTEVLDFALDHELGMPFAVVFRADLRYWLSALRSESRCRT
jgi:catechol 2,3-dioxygenase-like lactoylglutathione lyase family enzyme